MQLTIADGVVALIVLISAFLAYNRGLTREVLAIGGWLAAAFVAFYFAPMIAPLVLEIPYVGDFLRSSCTLTILAAFVAVFAAALIVLSIFTPLLSTAVHSTPLAPVDRGLGFLFGVARGVLLIAVIYVLYDFVVTDEERLAMIDGSASHALISDLAEKVRNTAPTAVPAWLDNRISALMGDCIAPGDNAALRLPFSAA